MRICVCILFCCFIFLASYNYYPDEKMEKEKITIIADAVSNLFPIVLEAKNLDIKVMKIHLLVGEQEFLCYDDIDDISAFSEKYFALMEDGVKMSTSLVSPGDYEQVFREEVNKGHKVICFTMAQGISGTYNSACIAKNIINEEKGDEVVSIIDSMTAGFGEGLQAIHASELVKQGLDYADIVKQCEEFKHFVRSDFTVDNIKYLLSTGRVSKVLGKFLNLINIRVMLKRSEKSTIAFAGAVMGRSLSIKKLAKTVVENIDTSKEQIIYITHCSSLDGANKLKEYLERENLQNIEIYDYDLISGAHIGPRSLAVFYVSKEAY